MNADHQQQKNRLLVFPVDIDSARETIAVANSLGMEVVGASSALTENQVNNPALAGFVRLPYITDEQFESQFLDLIGSQRITHVHTHHGVVWSHLSRAQQQQPQRYSFHLCSPSPYEQDWLRLIPSHQWADQVCTDAFVQTLHCPGTVDFRAPVQRSRLVSLHQQFCSIPGQSDEHKLATLTHIMRCCLSGDVVEIGSFQGRSAFALGWLAQHYQIGNLICVDPWQNSRLEDQGEQAAIVNRELQQGRSLIDLDKIFHSFIAAVSLLSNVGYIRETSDIAIGHYQRAVEQGLLPANELEALALTGNIALLHIDGNHRYDFVRKDIDLWLPSVINGGWVLLDDYVWAFGDGPKRVGDELLDSDLFDIAFTASDTLFLRKRLT